MKPLFLSVEGCDGAGKSTAIECIYNYLNSQGRECVVLRAMGTGVIGEHVRKCLFEQSLGDITAAISCAAAILNCYEHAYTFLDKGVDVIMDRGIPTFYAYNVQANKEPGADVILREILNSDILIPKKPDQTFFIDIDVQQAIERIQLRTGELTHFDLKPIEYFSTITHSLNEFLTENRIYNGWLIDNRKDINHMQNQLTSCLNSILK